MPTFKVVVIGPSGVGKTSLRGQYISARFSTSYRATIGADFITKTLPPSTPGGEPVVLQIWDTAGQERFASLASAFFRGADAAVLMYDLTNAETLYALEGWWAEFQRKAPVEDVSAFCVCVVGNKLDLVEDVGGGEGVVSAAQGARFVRALVPRAETPPPSPGAPPLTLADEPADDADSTPEDDADDALASSQLTARPPASSTPAPAPAPAPISILPHPHPPSARRSSSHSKSPHALSLSLARSASRSRSRGKNYASTITSTLTVYHTPSSSVFSASAFSDGDGDDFHSARSSYASTGFDDARSEATVTPARLSASSTLSSPPTSSPPTSPPSTEETEAEWAARRGLSHSPPLRRSPPAIDTHNATGAEGPSSSALSPLPYPQHFPAFAGFGGFGSAAPTSLSTAATSFSSGTQTGSATPTPRANGTASVADTSTPTPGGTATPLAKGGSTPRPNGTTGPGEGGTAHTHYLLEPDLPTPGASGAAHFRVSARTGAGVGEVFGWVARRLAYLHRVQEGALGFEGDPRVSLSGFSGGGGRGRGSGAEERGRKAKGGCC